MHSTYIVTFEYTTIKFIYCMSYIYIVSPFSLLAGPASSSWTKKSRSWQDALDENILRLDRTKDCFEKIEGDLRLGYQLPPRNSLAGNILIHCFSTVEKVLKRHGPATYKLGYTHCPHTRFYNQKFGYAFESHGWEQMLVLYVASETISPAFVEAALIQQHKGILACALNCMFTCLYIFLSIIYHL